MYPQDFSPGMQDCRKIIPNYLSMIIFPCVYPLNLGLDHFLAFQWSHFHYLN